MVERATDDTWLKRNVVILCFDSYTANSIGRAGCHNDDVPR